MTRYAAYDEMSIYGLGDTETEAIENARTEAREPEATFLVAKIANELAEQINRDGWDGKRQSFAIKDGLIIDTTND